MSESQKKIGVALFGSNGHQIHAALADHPHAKLVAVADFPRERLPERLRDDASIRFCDSLDDLLRDDRVEFVSLCSARRGEQAEHSIRCLRAGRHVYAEKPAAMNEHDLDRILAAAKQAGRRFHEMAGTAFGQPYLEARRIIKTGGIGTVVQAIAQKSYPMHDRRPQDEYVDAGLTMQVGIHAVRMIEHVAGLRVSDSPDAVRAIQTRLTNPVVGGGLRVACAIQMKTDPGALATVIANYCNPKSFGRWGNEMLRVFGTEGFVEITDGGQRTRWLRHDGDRGEFRSNEPDIEYHDAVFASILGLGEMPISIDEELHPTRVVIRARLNAEDLV